MKKTGFLFMIISLFLLLTGCWDRTEINDVAFVVASGVDKEKGNQYRFSLQIPLPSSLGGSGSSGGGGGTSGEGPFFVASGVGENLEEGVTDIQTKASRKIYFAHRRVLVIGEDVAKSGIAETLNAVFIRPQSRLSTFVVISRGDAMNVLQVQPQLEQFSGEGIREMALAGVDMTAMKIIQDMERPGKEAIIPMVEVTKIVDKKAKNSEILMRKFALFKGQKLAHITNKQESYGVMWLMNKMYDKSFNFTALKHHDISVRIVENQLKQSFHEVNGKPTFDLSIRATGTLLENQPNLRLEDPKTYQLVVGKMESAIRGQVHAILKHAHEKGIDANGFGWYLYKNQNQKWESNWKNGWDQYLPSLKVNVRVDADIQRTTNSGTVEKG